MADLQASKVLQFVGPTLMTETGVVKGWVEFLRDGRCPDFGDANSEFLTKARASLAFFCRVKGEDESEIVRKEAVESMLDHVTAGRSSTDSPPAFAELSPLQKFKWMLSVDQQAIVDGWTAAAWRSAGNTVDAKKKSRAAASKAPKASVVDQYFELGVAKKAAKRATAQPAAPKAGPGKKKPAGKLSVATPATDMVGRPA